MRYRTIGKNPETRREVSVLSLGGMLFGTAISEPTSFAILDRYVEAGGTFIDTSNNYAFWINGSQGGESEELLGRWRRRRPVRQSPRPSPGHGGPGADGAAARQAGRGRMTPPAARAEFTPDSQESRWKHR